MDDQQDFIESLPLTIQENLLNDSRITTVGNGNKNQTTFYSTPPTSGQKWWAAVILGFLFAIISSPVAYNISYSAISNVNDHIELMHGTGPNVFGLILQTIIFIIIIRIILW